MIPYNKLNVEDKDNIEKEYYAGTKFGLISIVLGVSERAVARVLKDRGINTSLKNRYTLDEEFFDVIDTEAKAYILGLLYADGFVGNEKFNNVSISLKESDVDILERMKSEIKFTGNLRHIINSGFNAYTGQYVLNFSSKHMTARLREIGLYPNKSMTLDLLPDLDDNLIRHFIRGYFDGDGCVGFYNNKSITNGKTYSYIKPDFNIIATKPFLEKIENYIGLKGCFKQSHTPEMFYLCYSSKTVIPLIYEYLYKDATIYLQRKYNKFNDTLYNCRLETKTTEVSR